MAISDCTEIPTAFNWLLPVQAVAAAVCLYSTIYIYSTPSTPFILALVAALLHFVFGVYCCFAQVTQRRRLRLHIYIVPIWLLIAGGLCCSVLVFLGRTLNMLSHAASKEDASGSLKWSQAGCGLCCVNLLVDLAQLILFLVPACRPRRTPRELPGVFISGPIYAVPPVAAQFQNHFPAPVPPEMMGCQSPDSRKDGDEDLKNLPIARIFSSPAKPSLGLSTGSAPPPNVSPPNPSHQTPWYPYNPGNRIDVIRRLCSLQHPDGHWSLSEELAELVKLWGGRDLMWLAGPGGQGIRGVTTVANACLRDLCDELWAAQRDGREHTVLSATEMISLKAVAGDLSWAKGALSRADSWMHV